jgi:hypothetical protein
LCACKSGIKALKSECPAQNGMAHSKEDPIASLLEQCKAHKDLFLSAAFSKPAKGAHLYEDGAGTFVPCTGALCKVKIKPVGKNGGVGYFAEFFTKEKSFHRTYSFDEFLKIVPLLFPRTFKTCAVNFCGDSLSFGITALANKKEKITLLNSRPKTNAQSCTLTGQNRVKRYIISEGEPVPFLVNLGVMTPKGTVAASKQKKFRQINRFLEYVDGCVKVFGGVEGIKRAAQEKKRAFAIMDFGSGKSYLTFAIHHLFTRVYGIPVEITGIEQKKDVAAHCEELARRLSCEGLSFIAARFTADAAFPAPDLLITLHACDTATDDALAFAVKNNVRAILCVPCCQHELNALLDFKNAPKEFAPFIKHGLLKERFAALATDAIRAMQLENAGYAVQLLEFIDDENTPKNLLIRAIKTNAENFALHKDPLSQSLGVSLTLEQLLKKRG